MSQINWFLAATLFFSLCAIAIVTPLLIAT
jgi:hypothetical protein